MGQVVLDSSNLDAIVKDATGEGLEVPQMPMNSGVQTQIDAEAAKIIADVEGAKAEPSADSEEWEERFGLTFAERQELLEGLNEDQRKVITDRLRKSVGKKHSLLKSAEAFAADQYNNRRLAEQKAADLEAQLQALKKPPEVVKPSEPPKREQFKTDDEYRDAQIDYAVEQRLKMQAEKDAKAAAEKRQAELVAEASARIAKAIELVPDFVEVTEAADMMVPPAVVGYMQKSPLFAELGYYLAKNPEMLTRLQNLAPDEQLVEIGEIKSTLKPFAKSAQADGAKTNGHDSDKSNSEHGAKPNHETGESPSPRASAPVIRPLNSGGASQVDKPESEMSAKEALAAYQKKNHVNLTRRSRH